MTGEVLSGVAGLVLGAVLASALLLGRLRAEQAACRTLQRRLDEAAAAEATLAELRGHLAGLRHDIRGILSPAMLVSDRLVSHQDAGIRRAGEVMIRTVERAVGRLAETKLDQEAPNKLQT